MMIPIKRRFLNLTDNEFHALCRDLKGYRIERDSEGTTWFQEPTSSYTGAFNASITTAVMIWNKEKQTGVVFDSNSGFTLPNGAIRSPDTSWIERSRWDRLSEKEKRSFAPICPDFVIEIRSQTDRLSPIQSKMLEFIENGAQLGWLIDPVDKKVWIYRADESVEEVDSFAVLLSGEAVLPGFELRLEEWWEE